MKKLTILLSLCLVFIMGFSTVSVYALTFHTSGTYKKGSKGDVVKCIQMGLTGIGYAPGAADGIYGSQTEAAVRAFQKAAGLKVDGVAGKDTLGRLREVVVNIQKVLRGKAGYTGSYDGIYGAGTTSAVEKYQRANKLTPDGICGSKTRAVMGVSLK